MTTPTSTPPGWYLNPAGQRQWWNGSGWSEQTLPLTYESAPASVAAPTTGGPVVSSPREMVTAYLLAIFLGQFGAHRFYLGRKGTAIAMLCLTVAALMILLVGVAVFFPVILAAAVTAGEDASGLAVAVPVGLGTLLLTISIGLPLAFSVWIWVIIDLFRIPEMIRQVNAPFVARPVWAAAPEVAMPPQPH